MHNYWRAIFKIFSKFLEGIVYCITGDALSTALIVRKMEKEEGFDQSGPSSM